jgi:hypothetical protein
VNCSKEEKRMKNRIIEEKEPPPPPRQFKVRDLVYHSHGLPILGEVIATANQRLVVRWQDSLRTVTMCAPAALRLAQGVDGDDDTDATTEEEAPETPQDAPEDLW